MIRPWLTAWLDWRTRRCTGRVLSPLPNSSTILAAMRHGLLDDANMGGPAIVWIDNGRDFDAWQFHGQTKKERHAKISITVDEPQTRGLFDLLAIKAHFSLPNNPNGKSRLERWFAQTDDFCTSFPTYCGARPQDKPESLQRTLDTPRLIPTFEHVSERFGAWVSGINARTDHRIDDLVDGDGQRLSPDEAMRRWCQTRRVMAAPQVLDLLLQSWHKPVRVGRRGIVINVAGHDLGYGAMDSCLSPFKAMKLADRPALHVTFDPHDLRSIRVYDDQYRYVATVRMNELGGRHADSPIDRQHVSELMRRKNAYVKAQRVTRQHRQLEYLTDAELLADAALDNGQDPPPANPNRLVLVQTPLDGAVSAVQDAEQRRAAGAEDLSQDILDDLDASVDALAALSRSRRAQSDDDDEPLELDLVNKASATVAEDDDMDVPLALSDPVATDDHGTEILDEI